MTNPEDRFDLCDQRRAILDGDGHMLVLGGPGSGKTTIALLKARRIVLAGLGDTQAILFLSFSNAAVRRIADSTASFLAGEVGRRVEIKTYHSFAWDLLRSHGYLLSSQRRLKILPAQDADIRRSGLSEKAWQAEQTRLFEEDGLVTYDHFAPRVAELLECCPRLRDLYANAYPVILVDEFQDTDEEQWAIVKSLSSRSDIIALGDPEQRIYEWRPGVSPKRLDEFRVELDPQVFDFGGENNRSPKTGIVTFGQALLNPKADFPVCKEIKVARFKPGQSALWIKLSTKHALGEARKRVGTDDISVAVAGRSKALVRLISDALSQEHEANGVRHGPIVHDVLIDQSQILLSARVTAFLLEAVTYKEDEALARSLDLIADMHRCGGKKSHIKKADQIAGWAAQVRSGTPKMTKLVAAVADLLKRLHKNPFTGSPMGDWVDVRQELERAHVDDLSKVSEFVRFLRLLRRGSAIEENLAELWRSQGHYRDAMQAVEDAILREQVLDSVRPTATCTVMTMHQLKGREYDVVVIIEDEYRRFLDRDEKPPYMGTRRLLQVSVTRAREYVIFVIPPKNSTFQVLYSNP